MGLGLGDHLVRGFLSERTARVLAAVTTDLSRDMAARHELQGGIQVALSRGATAAVLLATLAKDRERVTFQIRSDGPLGGLTADAWADGRVRGYMHRKQVDVPAPTDQRLLLTEWMGRHGVVNVVRDLGLKEKYTGQATVITGEIDEDVENYLRVSEQIPSALGCEAVMGEDGRILAAAGVMVQSLPGGVGEEVVRAVQHNLRTGLLYEALEARAHATEGAAGLMRVILEEHAPTLELLGSSLLHHECSCSDDRVANMLKMLGADQLETLIREDGQAEVFCDFCNQRYLYSEVDLERLRRDVNPRSDSQS